MKRKVVDLSNGYTKETEYLEAQRVERYYLNGKFHREDGPAIIWYYESGMQPQEVYYYINGKSHREDGPAVIHYYKSGKIRSAHYYLNDQYMSKEEFENQMLKKNISLI